MILNFCIVFACFRWCRPHKIFEDPVYFNGNSKQLAVNQGSLPDHVFLGTLMAICAYSKYDLIENIFASRPEDFLKYGIYTCRFYVDGEWVEVITDTHVPCLKDNRTGNYNPVYGSSNNPNEMWVAFVEKAFAKAMGSYEEIPNIKVQKALLHLTGGSVQPVNIKDEISRYDAVSDNEAWNVFRKKLDNDSIVLMMPNDRVRTAEVVAATVGVVASAIDSGGSVAAATSDGTVAAPIDGSAAPAVASINTNPNHNHHHNNNNNKNSHKEDYFIPDMLYSVILCRELGGYEMVLMHNPWKNTEYEWTGEWSDQSNDWDLYPELLVEIEKDPTVPWRRLHPNGYFWISFRNLIKYFSKTFYCKLFPSDKFNFYCARGECRAPRHCGGPLNPILDRDIVLRDAALSRAKAITKVNNDIMSLYF